MNLVEDWKDCWRWFSTRAMVIAAALQTGWMQIPENFKADVPPSFVHWLTVAILVAGVVGRVVKQKGSVADEPLNDIKEDFKALK